MTDRAINNRRKGDKVQNALLSAALALLLWLLQQIMTVSTGVATINSRLPELEIKASAAYRTADARRDYTELDARLKRVERRAWHEGSMP